MKNIKIKVPNISLQEYFSSKVKSDYDYYLTYGDYEPLDLFELGSFTNQPFGFVKDVQEHLNIGLSWSVFIDLITEKKKIPAKTIAKESIFKLHQARLFIRNEIININEMEKNNLVSPATTDHHSAGLSNFKKFKSFIQFDKLTNGDVTKIDQVKQLPYGICFAKLLLEKEKDDFNNRYAKIKERKAR